MMTKNFADPRFGVAQLGNGVFTGLLASSSITSKSPQPWEKSREGPPESKRIRKAWGEPVETVAT